MGERTRSERFAREDGRGGAGGRSCDLAVLGSGGGAFAAAIAARRRGLDVVLVERSTVGGTCVNVGCIPSKALLAAAEARHRAGANGFPGIRTHAGRVEMNALLAGKASIVESLRDAKYVGLAADQGIEIVRGDARFAEGPALDLGDGRRIEARHYLVATGAEPDVPGIPGLAETRHLTSTTAMELPRVPERLVVLGGGFVGLEQAQLFSRLGSRVALVVRSSLLRGAEPEIAESLRGALADEGIELFEGAAPRAVTQDAGRIRVELEDGGEVGGTDLLVATGTRPRTAGLRLESVGLETGPGGELPVDATMRTENPRIWAAGDVTGHPQFVYAAAAHGGLVVENAFGGAGRRIDYSALPRIVFTTPAVASAGLTERQAADAGHSVDARVLALEHVPRAIVSRDTRGLVKIVADAADGRVLGVHMLADGAGDAILAAVYAIEAGFTVGQIASSWAPYLTISEGIKLAAQAFTRDPASLSCCAA